jgi:hypothetical protein
MPIPRCGQCLHCAPMPAPGAQKAPAVRAGAETGPGSLRLAAPFDVPLFVQVVKARLGLRREPMRAGVADKAEPDEEFTKHRDPPCLCCTVRSIARWPNQPSTTPAPEVRGTKMPPRAFLSVRSGMSMIGETVEYCDASAPAHQWIDFVFFPDGDRRLRVCLPALVTTVSSPPRR